MAGLLLMIQILHHPAKFLGFWVCFGIQSHAGFSIFNSSFGSTNNPFLGPTEEVPTVPRPEKNPKSRLLIMRTPPNRRFLSFSEAPHVPDKGVERDPLI